MKFHSSDVTAAPIQGYSNTYYLENKYIPTSSVRDFADSWNNDSTIEEKDNEYSSNDNHNGRILRYDTITMTFRVPAWRIERPNGTLPTVMSMN
jgi:hypothetical protein